MSVKCVLFDIDNTLLLKKPSIPEKVFETAKPFFPELKMEDVERAYAKSELWQGEQIQKENETGVRMSDEEFLQNIFRVYRQSLGLPGEAFGQLKDVFMRNYFMEYELVPGAVEALERLKARGLRLGIVSNNTPKVRAQLTELGLDGFFDCIVISEEVDIYKPDPAILELACEKLEVHPGESVYVGDHPYDILCAHKAGMPVIWMPVNPYITVPGYIGPPEHRISALTEIPELVNS